MFWIAWVPLFWKSFLFLSLPLPFLLKAGCGTLTLVFLMYELIFSLMLGSLLSCIFHLKMMSYIFLFFSLVIKFLAQLISPSKWFNPIPKSPLFLLWMSVVRCNVFISAQFCNPLIRRQISTKSTLLWKDIRCYTSPRWLLVSMQRGPSCGGL